jgi:lipoate-protein ligase B
MKVEHRRQQSSTECGIIPQDRLRGASVLLVVNDQVRVLQHAQGRKITYHGSGQVYVAVSNERQAAD